MSAMHHWAIARTPLQLFNCIEARDRFHEHDENTLVYIYRKDVDRQLMQPMIDDRWRKVVFFKLTGLRRNFYPWFLMRLLPRRGSVDTCTIGLPKHLSAHIINTLKPRHVRLIDDGNEMLIIAKQFADMADQESRGLAQRMFGKRESLAFLRNATIFTIHDISDSIPPQRLVRNDYREFRKVHADLPRTEEVVFIGSPVYERDLIDKEEFMRALGAIQNHFAGQPITYYPHRYEDISRLTNDLCSLGIRLAAPEEILEYAFAKRGHLPGQIVSFRSSALETLRDLYGLDGIVMEWNLDSIVPHRKSMYETLYQNYRDQHFQMIPLTSLKLS